MELHNQLQMYVGLEEGGCQDVATIKLDGFTLVSTKALELLLSERDALAHRFNDVSIAAKVANSLCAVLEAERDALAAQLEVLLLKISIASNLLTKGFNSQHFEASDVNHALCALAEAQHFTPNQCLAEIKAQALQELADELQNVAPNVSVTGSFIALRAKAMRKGGE